MARVTVRQQGTRLEAVRHCHLERPGDSVLGSPTAAVQGLRPVGRSDLAPAWNRWSCRWIALKRVAVVADDDAAATAIGS